MMTISQRIEKIAQLGASINEWASPSFVTSEDTGMEIIEGPDYAIAFNQCEELLTHLQYMLDLEERGEADA